MTDPRMMTRTVPDWQFLLNGGHHEGPSDAPVKLIEFSDFQCPYCKKLEPELKHLLKKYRGKIEFIYRNFPLPAHSQALQAAKAGECSAEQNDFWSYHDALYSNQALFRRQPWDSIARLAGIRDVKTFNGCMKDTLVNKVIEKDIRLGERIGVHSTPTLVVSGKMVSGVLLESQLDQMVREAMKRQN